MQEGAESRVTVDELMLQGIQDAYITISLVDGKGNVMGRSQDTPTTNNLAGNYVLFNCKVWPFRSSLLYA